MLAVALALGAAVGLGLALLVALALGLGLALALLVALGLGLGLALLVALGLGLGLALAVGVGLGAGGGGGGATYGCTSCGTPLCGAVTVSAMITRCTPISVSAAVMVALEKRYCARLVYGTVLSLWFTLMRVIFAKALVAFFTREILITVARSIKTILSV